LIWAFDLSANASNSNSGTAVRPAPSNRLLPPIP